MMYFQKYYLLIFFVITLYTGSYSQEIDYFNQAPPGRQPEVFAPGLISTGNMEFYISFSHDGNLCLFISVASTSD